MATVSRLASTTTVKLEPYGLELAKALAPEIDVEMWSCGMSGVTAQAMSTRLHDPSIRDSLHRKGQGICKILADLGPFDLAIIMAGTNDLEESHPEMIAKNVQMLHEACRNAGVPTVALSIPPSGFNHSRRLDANAGIARWAESRCASAPERLFDVAKVLPFPEPGTAEEDARWKLWEADELHFSPEGSQSLGRSLAPMVSSLLRQGEEQGGGGASL